MARIPFACVIVLVAGCASTPTPPERSTVASQSPVIVQAGAEVLRRRAAEVPIDRIRTPEFQSLVSRMVDAMRKAPGVGLAAPQLGEPWRVFVVEDPEALMSTLTDRERQERQRVPVPLRVFINPVITGIGDGQATFFEGCLSVAGYAALVTRHAEVEVSALDETGAPVTWRVRGWPARILQHELDHLNGTLYVDRMHTRSFGTAAHIKERFAGLPIDEVLRSFELTAPH